MLAELCKAVKQTIKAHSNLKMPGDQILTRLGNPNKNNVIISRYLLS